MTDKLHDETSRIIGHNGEEASLFEVPMLDRDFCCFFIIAEYYWNGDQNKRENKLYNFALPYECVTKNLSRNSHRIRVDFTITPFHKKIKPPKKPTFVEQWRNFLTLEIETILTP